MLIVEDGSADDSLPILRRLESDVPAITVLSNPRNMGKGYSIRNGILNSRGRYIIFTDIDMAYSDGQRARDARETGSRRAACGRQPSPSGIRLRGQQSAGQVRLSPPPRRHRVQHARPADVRPRYARHTERAERLYAWGGGAHFQRLHTDGFLFDIEIFIRARTLAIPVTEVPVRLTYEDDVTTVQQFRQLFTVIPGLIHIKMLQLRGAYGAARPTNQPRSA